VYANALGHLLVSFCLVEFIFNSGSSSVNAIYKKIRYLLGSSDFSYSLAIGRVFKVWPVFEVLTVQLLNMEFSNAASCKMHAIHRVKGFYLHDRVNGIERI